jgi:RNA polymerase sigma factor (sigma-70 family)
MSANPIGVNVKPDDAAWTDNEHDQPEEASASRSVPLEPYWPLLVDRIRSGDPSAMEDLYRVFSKGIRFYLCRQLGPQDLDDKVHDIFLIIAQSIQKGDLREPDRLMGYVRTVVRRQVAAHIDDVVQARRNQTDLEIGMTLSDHQPSPERSLIEQQHSDLAKRILRSLNKRDREVLIRFYLEEQAPNQICSEMKLTETQFRLIKSRAKARFGALGKRRLALRSGWQTR